MDRRSEHALGQKTERPEEGRFPATLKCDAGAGWDSAWVGYYCSASVLGRLALVVAALSPTNRLAASRSPVSRCAHQIRRKAAGSWPPGRPEQGCESNPAGDPAGDNKTRNIKRLRGKSKE